MGILHAGLAPALVVGGVKPNVVLVGVVLVTSLLGLAQSIPWAFVSGTTVNLLGFEPLGSVPLALLIVAAVVGGGRRAVGRPVWIFPIAAAVVGSVVYDAVTLGVLTVLNGVDVPNPLDVIARAAALNAAVTALLLVPARALARRVAGDESTGL